MTESMISYLLYELKETILFKRETLFKELYEAEMELLIVEVTKN
jgi:hypothetical protein